MARPRSITIYADSETEFESLLLNSNTPSKKKNYTPSYDSDDEDEGLGASCSYSIKRKSLSIEEQEKKAEERLLEKISKLNLKYKEGTLDETASEDNDSQTDEEEESNTECVTPDFIEQNVNTFDEIVKLIVIGAKNVGKSTFINKLTNSPSKQNDVTYSPTSSLEIKKVIKSFGESKVKIELWDTNENIIKSSLIKTYYQIAGGFIIIVDSKTNFDFIKKQMELIQTVTDSDANFYILYNTKGSTGQESVEELDVYIKEKIINLQNQFMSEIQVMNVNDCSFEKEIQFQSFLRTILRSNDHRFHSLKFRK